MTTFTPTLRQRLRLLVTGHPALAFSAGVPGIIFYGGATVTRAHDATGQLYTCCCAKDAASGKFGLYVLNGDTPILIRPVRGRGSVWISLFDGHAYWVGFDGNAPPQGGPIPGFAPFVSLIALAERLAAVEAGGGGGARAPLAIPAGGAIASLWPHPYTPAEVDTPAEVAIKLTKSNAAVLEMVELLKAAGVLV